MPMQTSLPLAVALIAIPLAVPIATLGVACGEDRAAEDMIYKQLIDLGADVQNFDHVTIYNNGAKTPRVAEVLRLVRQSRRIIRLEFSGIALSEVELAEINQLENIAELGLTKIQLSESLLKALAKAHRVTYLMVSRCRLSPRTADVIGQFKKLDLLWIDQCRGMNKSDFAFLRQLKDLKHLAITNTDVEDRTKAQKISLLHFNDATANVLRGNQSIVDLGLSGTYVTDAVFGTLESMPNLNYVVLSGTDVSQAALEKYRQRHPDISVIYQYAPGELRF